MPGWLEPFTFANPLRYMIVIVKVVFLKSSRQRTFANVWTIAVIAAFTLSLCDLVFPPSTGVGGGRNEEHEQRGALGC
jgi:ABC-2 type transport system permease protein